MNLENMGHYGYQTTHLESRIVGASPMQLVLVLTDGLLDELARARGHIEGKRYDAKGASINKCISILNGLSSSLDIDGGNEVAINLGRLYDYCAWRLNEAGCSLSVSPLDEVVQLIGVLREGWQGALDAA